LVTEPGQALVSLALLCLAGAGCAARTTREYPLKYVDAKDVAAIAQLRLDLYRGRGTVTVSPCGDALTVKADADGHSTVEDLVEDLNSEATHFALETTLVYLDARDAAKLTGLTGEAAAGKILELSRKRRNRVDSFVWAWRRENESGLTFGQILCVGCSLTEEQQKVERSRWAENFRVEFDVARGGAKGHGVLPLKVRCTCYAASSEESWEHRHEFVATSLTNVLAKSGVPFVLGDGVPTRNRKKVFYAVFTPLAFRKAKAPLEKATPRAPPPVWSTVSRFGLLDYEAQDAAVDEDSIYVIGRGRLIDLNLQTEELRRGDVAWFIEKRDKRTGAPVRSFGRNGIVLTRAGDNPDYPFGERRLVATDRNHLYVATTTGEHWTGANESWRIEKRDKRTGVLDKEFGVEGVIVSPDRNDKTAPKAGRPMSVTAVKVTDRHLYVLGSQRTMSASWAIRLEKRDKRTGARIEAFGSQGVVLSTEAAYERAMSLRDDRLFIMSSSHIEKRSAISGALDNRFGRNGVIRFNPNSGMKDPNAMVADSDAIWIVGSKRHQGGKNLQWRIEKRDAANGRLLEEFDDGGILAPGRDSSHGYANEIVADKEHLYVVGHTWANGNEPPAWRLEKRCLRAGKLTVDFGTDGAMSLSKMVVRTVADDRHLYVVLREDIAVDHSQWRLEKRSKVTGGR